LFESCSHSMLLDLCMEPCFGLGGRDVSDWAEEVPIVEPVDPCEGCHFDLFDTPPGAETVDHLGLVEAVDRLGQGLVVTVAGAAHRGFKAGLTASLDYEREIGRDDFERQTVTGSATYGVQLSPADTLTPTVQFNHDQDNGLQQSYGLGYRHQQDGHRIDMGLDMNRSGAEAAATVRANMGYTWSPGSYGRKLVTVSSGDVFDWLNSRNAGMTSPSPPQGTLWAMADPRVR